MPGGSLSQPNGLFGSRYTFFSRTADSPRQARSRRSAAKKRGSAAMMMVGFQDSSCSREILARVPRPSVARDIDPSCRVNRGTLRRARQGGRQAVGAEPIINMRPIIGGPDLLYPSYPRYGEFKKEPQIVSTLTDAEKVTQRHEYLLQAIEAVINKNVWDAASLLHGVGEGRAFGRDRAGVDYEIGPIVERRLGDAFRGAVLAKVKNQALAPRLAALPFRRIDAPTPRAYPAPGHRQEPRRCARPAVSADVVRQVDAAAGGIGEHGGGCRRGGPDQRNHGQRRRGKEQAPCSRDMQAKRHRPSFSTGDFASDYSCRYSPGQAKPPSRTRYAAGLGRGDPTTLRRASGAVIEAGLACPASALELSPGIGGRTCETCRSTASGCGPA